MRAVRGNSRGVKEGQAVGVHLVQIIVVLREDVSEGGLAGAQGYLPTPASCMFRALTRFARGEWERATSK
jgi:hypothetical protein